MRRLAAACLLLIATQTHAASYPPSLHWRTITTEHFFIDYHQGEEELARRAAMYAESAHARVAPMMGWEPSGRTHIVLADHVDLSNGSATPFPTNRIEIYVTAPGGDPSSPIDNYDNWLNLVITHEYTHILHLDQARGFSRVMRNIFGRNPLLSFPNEFTPLWFIEGIATLSESENTNAGRLKGTYVDMALRTAAVEDRWATEAQASGLGPYWPTGNSRYYYGSKFLSWLETTRGRDKLTQFMNDYSGNVVPFRINASAEDVYGTSMKELWEQWGVEQQKTYRADRDRLAADGLTDRTRLTTLGYETTHPIVSPDGTRVAYAHRGPYERPTIRVRDIASNRDIATHATNDISPLSWSADGRSIAYSDIELVKSFSLLSDLYIWEPGHGTRRITNGARLKDPAFTPDARTLIAVQNGGSRNQLVEVDVASGAIKRIVSPDDNRQFEDPAVSHDGSRIAVAEWQNGTVNIVLLRRSGERIANLTPSFPGAINASPRFSRDDRTIWFSSDVTGVANVYAVDVAGAEPRRLTNVYGGALYPSSIDGKRFLYSDYSADGFDLATFNATREYAVLKREPSSPAAQPRTEDRGPRTSDSEYSPWQSLRPRWWFPVIGSAAIGGENKPIFGITTSGADVLGRHTYEATLTNRLYGVVYSYDRFYPTFTLAASQFDEDFSSATSVTDRVVAQMTVPLNRVQWQSAASIGLIRDHIGGSAEPRLFRGTLQGFRVGVFFNNAHEYLYSISLERGVTANVDYENLKGDASLQTIRGDLRGYLTIPWAASPLGHHVLAARVAGGRNTGDFVLQRQLKVGGDSTGELTTLDLTNFPVRGFDDSTLRGQSAAIASVEYRFPLYEIERGPATWPIFFNRVHGDVWSDAGRVSGQHIASAGAEGAVDFIIANEILIRYRMGAAFRLTDPDKGKVVPYISIGSSF